MRFANRRHGVAAKLLREEDRRLSAARRHHQDVAPAEQYVLMESKFLWRGTRRPDVRSLRRVVANTSGHVSPAMLAGIQNPCPLRRVRTPPDQANCRALKCSAIQSGRPAAWLRRPERPR